MCYRLEMARKHILNWSKTVRQWCKTINGKKVYFGTASAKSNWKDYLKAEARYRAYMAELDKNPDLDKTPRQVLVKESDGNSQRIGRRRRISVIREEWLQTRQAAVVGGNITQGRLNQLRTLTEPLVEFLGEDFQLSKLKGDHLRAYRNHSDAEVIAGTLKVSTQAQRLANTKTFLNWSWRENRIRALPRNMDDVLKPQKIQIDRSLIQIFAWNRTGDNKETRRGWKTCADVSKEMELWFLLGLNCGYTWADISSLRMEDCKWRSKSWTRIVKMRHKTKVRQEHVLWSRTEELFKELAVGRYGSTDYCFLDRGRPLNQSRIEGSKIFSTRIPQQFNRNIRKAFGSGDTRSHKTLRKTGASYCLKRMYGTEDLYLAHAPTRMSERFYTPPDFTQLNKVLCYAEVDFGISDTLIKRWEQ
jgi:integrase